MQATIMYKDMLGGIYRVVMPDNENFWYDANKSIYDKRQVRKFGRSSVVDLLTCGYKVVGRVNNFKPKL